MLEEVVERIRLSVDLQAGPGLLEAPHPLPVLGMFVLPALSIVGAIFKNEGLRQQYVIEATWTEWVTKSSYGFYVNLLNSGRWVCLACREMQIKTTTKYDFYLSE